MINRVILVGNLTRDAEASTGPATTLTRMRIATNAVWRDGDGNRQESAEFHNVVAFGKLAEICSSYCLRGRRVYIEGRLRTREYEGGDGLRRYTTEIVADSMRLLDRAPSAGSEETPHVDGGEGGNAGDGTGGLADPVPAVDEREPSDGATPLSTRRRGPAQVGAPA